MKRRQGSSLPTQAIDKTKEKTVAHKSLLKNQDEERIKQLEQELENRPKDQPLASIPEKYEVVFFKEDLKSKMQFSELGINRVNLVNLDEKEKNEDEKRIEQLEQDLNKKLEKSPKSQRLETIPENTKVILFKEDQKTRMHFTEVGLNRGSSVDLDEKREKQRHSSPSTKNKRSF